MPISDENATCTAKYPDEHMSVYHLDNSSLLYGSDIIHKHQDQYQKKTKDNVGRVQNEPMF